MVAMVFENEHAHLLHADGIFYGNQFIGMIARELLDGAFLITVRLYFQAVELYLFSAERTGLFQYVYPVLECLTGMTIDKLNVHLETHFQAVLYRLLGRSSIVRAVHLLQHSIVERLYAYG